MLVCWGNLLKKIKFSILIFLFSLSISYSQDLEIKSLQVYSDDRTALPVVLAGQKLTIEFDIKSSAEPNLNIVFRFCDKNWNPYQNAFLTNSGKNIEYNLDFDLLPFTVGNDARYHFKRSFPNKNEYVNFPFSGKWMFFITNSQDTSKIYSSGKFFVIDSKVDLNVSKKDEVLEDKTYFPNTLAHVFNITTEFLLPQDFFPGLVDHLEIIENQKLFYPIIIDKNFNTNTRQFYWDADRKMSFTARDLRPGNEYRQTDLRDFNKFNSVNVKAQFDGIEYSRFYKKGRKDLNGGFLFTNFKNENAAYLNVTFSMKPPDDTYSDIFLVGAFNNWKVLPEYALKKNNGVFSKTIQLKRGIYDYQYVTADLINDQIENIDWFVLEGNYYETSNAYYIFLYYNETNYGGYDRIIGYKKIITN